ncbi:MAG: hypothetical protein EA398_05630 [Deltaproteobacteria bacterium]|nr:MAG: hypothetical protein EA398_05630 [Deltaproteobacteria bacterium]
MTMARITPLILLVTLLLVSPAMAQEVLQNEALNTQVTQPDGWNTATGSDRTTFTFRHPESQSQIEIIGTQLITADVADIFFGTFHETVRGAEFLNPQESERSYGSRTGTETIYAFSHSGVELRITVFQFVENDIAWLVVSYIPVSDVESLGPVLGQVIDSIVTNTD